MHSVPMKGKLFVIIILFTCLKGYSDSAQPGVWRGGGTSDFALLYPEDSNAYKKIQMRKEFVSIQLYKGFAVIKGEYWMYNTTNDTFQIKTGYPLNSTLEAENGFTKANVYFDSLSQLQVFVNGQPAKIISEPNNRYTKKLGTVGNSNWYVWVTKFKPMDSTKLDVYFIVNISNGSITSGYSHQNLNAFSYILESGSTWKQPICKGTIIVQLMEKLKADDINGVWPSSIFRYNKENELLKYDFIDLSPTSSNNIIITLPETGVDFKEVGDKKQIYFDAIDKLSKIQLSNLQFDVIKFRSPLYYAPVNYIRTLLIGLVIVILLIWLIIKVKR
jgi:hypothetical protein